MMFDILSSLSQWCKMSVVTEQPSPSKGGHLDVKTTLPASLQLLSTATEVTVKQHIDSAEGNALKACPNESI